MKALLFFAKSSSLALINQLLLLGKGVKDNGDHVTIGLCTMIFQEEIAKENAIAPIPAFIIKNNPINKVIRYLKNQVRHIFSEENNNFDFIESGISRAVCIN